MPYNFTKDIREHQWTFNEKSIFWKALFKVNIFDMANLNMAAPMRG